ncbi:MAG: hypothetical protein RBR97_11120 [Bacteroidales bacterium]|nr:hypothetical protein [Bacteroidales bacterium]
MRKIIPIIILAMTISSCNQEKIYKLELQISQLEKELIEKTETIVKQEKEILSLREELEVMNKKINERNRIKQYSDYEIIDIVKKDREYYCPNAKRKNFVVRKIDTNIYDVRFDYMSTDPNVYQEWIPTVYRIQFFPNNKYTLKLQKGAIC